MTHRFWLSAVATALLLGGLAVSSYDRAVTRQMVSCLRSTFGEAGAPVTEIKECGARWDGRFGHQSTRALFVDTPGPIGGFLTGVLLAWACAPAILLLVLALAAQRRRTSLQWASSLAPALLLAGYFVGYYAALQTAEQGDLEHWTLAQSRFQSLGWIVLAAALLSALACLTGGSVRAPLEGGRATDP